ncbi:MAG: TIGR02147 family protein [Bdellovibrionia bacterium]
MNVERAPELLTYHDYRLYLRRLLAFYKSSGTGHSMRGLAEALGVTAPYLSYVLSGRRPLSNKTRDRLMKELKFSAEEKSYFKLLCVLGDSTDQAERVRALNLIQNFREYRQLNPKETEAYRYLTHWFYPAIREMVQLPEFKADPKWIQPRLCYSVSQDEIEKALNFLIKFEFIKVEPDGHVTLPQKKVECDGGVFKIALSAFHRQLLSLAGDSIDKFAREERHLIGHMLPIPAESFGEISKILDECLKRVSALSDTKKGPNAIYHFGFFGFPVAKAGHEE